MKYIALLLILLPLIAFADEPKDEPIQVASLLMLGVGKATFAKAPGTATWFALLPSSTDIMLMPSSTDKVKLPGH